MFDLDAVSEALPGRMVLWLESTDSTMLDAARLAAGGCPSGAVIGAEEQTGGLGRQGHAWHSEAGTGLYFSLVLRERLPADQLPVLTMALGLAAAEAITQTNGLVVDLRWPNDVMIGDRKAAGILVQQHPGALIAGIGINVNQAGFPAAIESIATSLRLASGGSRTFAREPLLTALLAAIDRHVEILTAAQGKEAILRLFTQASSYVAGRRVVVEQNHTLLRGTTAGMDPDGFLILRQDDGHRTLILAGGVRPE